MTTHFTIRCQLLRLDETWLATVTEQQVLVGHAGVASSACTACTRLAVKVWAALPTLTLEDLDGADLASITGIRVFATTETFVPLIEAMTPDHAPGSPASAPRQRVHTVHYTLTEADSRIHATANTDAASAADAIAGGGPTAAAALTALANAVQRRLRREPPDGHAITALRLIGTRTLDFSAELLTRRNAS